MRSVPGFVIPLKKIMGWVRRRRVRSSKKATKSQAVTLPDDIILKETKSQAVDDTILKETKSQAVDDTILKETRSQAVDDIILKETRSQAVTLPSDIILRVLTKQPIKSLVPNDIIVRVLGKLPIKSLVRFKCVSKSCNCMVSNPHFLQLNQRSANNPSLLYYRCDYFERKHIYCLTFDIMNSCFYDVQLCPPWKQRGVRCNYQTCDYYEILGSCNGLLCVIGMSRDGPAVGDLILWNPLTGHFRILPKCPYGGSPYQVECKGKASYGFGYDVSTDDYKVVRAVDHSELDCSEIYVFSVKSNTWSSGKVHCTPMKMLSSVEYSQLNLSSNKKYSYEYEKGILLDGILHWLPPHYGRVTTFDLSTEEFGTILLPECNPIFGDCIYLGTLSGCLCFWYYYNNCIDLGTDGLMVDVWVMKEYGVMSSWTKLLVVSPGIPRGCYPKGDAFVPFLFSSKKDELIYFMKRIKPDEGHSLKYNWDNCRYRMAVKYNLRNLTFDDVRELPDSLQGYSFPYMESLVSIGKSFRAAAS